MTLPTSKFRFALGGVIALCLVTGVALALADGDGGGAGGADDRRQGEAPVLDLGEPTASDAPGDPAAGAQDPDQKAPQAKKKTSSLETSAREFLPILVLLVVVAFVIARLPRVEGVAHSAAFRRRRVANWLPLGLTYAFLYMGRYNLTVSKGAFEKLQSAGGGPMMDNADFGLIFAAGTVVYGFSFLINGPLTDRYGGKMAILVGAAGSAVANLLMGLCTLSLVRQGPMSDAIAANFVLLFAALYSVNMYFQSFGAVAIVKVNAPWFHVRERGVFGAIFGILISLGIYFAFDVGRLIRDHVGLSWVFLLPAVLLVAMWFVDVALVRNSPGEAGFDDFETADATSEHGEQRLGAIAVFMLMIRNPIIMTIACIEFCSGFLRQAIMQWYQTFARQTDGALGLAGGYVVEHWGMLLCAAGILGGVFAGIISDRVYGSRRGPVSALLYAMMLVGGVVMTFTYQTAFVGPLVIFMSMAVIGVHGMLSGTASMDFGGKQNVGVAVGIIDGFVYLGTAVMSLTYAAILPTEQLDAAGKLTGPATDPGNWLPWPISMIIVSAIGFVLARKIWHAMPRSKPTAVRVTPDKPGADTPQVPPLARAVPVRGGSRRGR